MQDAAPTTAYDRIGGEPALRTIIDGARPRHCLFRSNHASNYLPLAGVLPKDRERIVATIDRALAGQVALRPEWARGL